MKKLKEIKGGGVKSTSMGLMSIHLPVFLFIRLALGASTSVINK
ncbi:MAG: hypothetical protein ACJA13_002133 [Paraglaciecola sp.]|jgi:hypothetical protein